MNLPKRWVAFSAMMFILGFTAAFVLASLTWIKFVDNFIEFPYNQGLLTGAAIFEDEVYNQCPDFNASKISPEYYAAILSVFEENGSDSIACWLSDTSNAEFELYGRDCEVYYKNLEKARELIK